MQPQLEEAQALWTSPQQVVDQSLESPLVEWMILLFQTFLTNHVTSTSHAYLAGKCRVKNVSISSFTPSL